MSEASTHSPGPDRIKEPVRVDDEGGIPFPDEVRRYVAQLERGSEVVYWGVERTMEAVILSEDRLVEDVHVARTGVHEEGQMTTVAPPLDELKAVHADLVSHVEPQSVLIYLAGTHHLEGKSTTFLVPYDRYRQDSSKTGGPDGQSLEQLFMRDPEFFTGD